MPSSIQFNDDDELSKIYNSCIVGNLDEIETSFSNNDPLILLTNNSNRLFLLACKFGHLHIINWLLLQFNEFIVDVIHMNNYKAFMTACTFNKLDTAMTLHEICTKYGKPIDYNIIGYDAFLSTCKHGAIEIGKWICSLVSIDLHKNDMECFKMCCKSGYHQYAKWMYELSVKNGKPFIIDGMNINHQALFVKCCEVNKNEDIIELLLSISINDVSTRALLYDTGSQQAFITACNHGNLEIVKILLSKSTININSGQINSLIHTICTNEYIEMLRYLHLTYPNKFVIDANLFVWCCENNLVEIAQWIYNDVLGKKIKIIDNDENIVDFSNRKRVTTNRKLKSAFESACLESQIDIMNLIYDVYKSSEKIINLSSGKYFNICCSVGFLRGMRWIVETVGKNNSVFNLDANFKFACKRGYFEVAKYLFALGFTSQKPINIRCDGDYAFRKSYVNEHIDIARWLVSLCHDYEIESDGNDSWHITTWDNLHPIELTTLLLHQLHMKSNGQITLNDDDVCAICHQSFVSSICQLPCRHYYCTRCFVTCFVQRGSVPYKSCAICRSKFKFKLCTFVNSITIVKSRQPRKKQKK